MADWKKVVLAKGTSSQYIKGDGTFATYSAGGAGLGDDNTWTGTNTFNILNSTSNTTSVLGNLRNTHASGYGLKIQATDANSARYIATFNDKDDNVKARIMGNGHIEARSLYTTESIEIRKDTGELYFSNTANSKYFRIRRLSDTLVFDRYDSNTVTALTIGSNGNTTFGGNIVTSTSTGYARLKGHSGGLQIKSSTTGYTGISSVDNAGTFRWTIYGDTNGYGFLGSEWGSWDLRKDVGGKLYTGTGTTYYVQPDSHSYFVSFATSGTGQFGGNVTIEGGTSTSGLATADMALQIGGNGTNGQYNAIGFGYNGQTQVPAIIAYKGTSGAGSTHGELGFYTRSVTTNTAPTQRMVIDTSGNIGIGTASPGSILHAVQASDGAATEFILDNSASAGSTDEKVAIRLRHAGATGARILSERTEDFASAGAQSANLCLQTAKDGTLATRLLVKDGGDVEAYGSYLKLSNATNPYLYINDTNGAKGIFQAYGTYVNIGSDSNHETRIVQNNAVKLKIDTDGNSTFYGGYLRIDAGGTNMAITTNSDTMHFIADSNANGGTHNPFEWWHDSPTIDGGTKIMHLSSGADLWIGNDLTVVGGIGSGSITSSGSIDASSGKARVLATEGIEFVPSSGTSSYIKVASTGDLEIKSAGGDLDIPLWLRMRASAAGGTITGAWKNDATSKLHLGGDCTQTDYTLKIDATPLTSGSLYTVGNATFGGDVTIGSNELIFDAGEKVFSTGGYVVADGDAGFIARDSGVNKLIINGNTATFSGSGTFGGSLDIGDDASGPHRLTIHSRYESGAPSIHFRTGHPNNANVWTLGKIQVFDDGNYNGSMRFYTSTTGLNQAIDGGMTEALEIDSSQNSFFAGDVTLTDVNSEIRMRESGDNNYYVALSSYHNAGDTFALYGLKGDYLKHIRTDDSDEDTHTLRIGGAMKRVDIWSNSVQRVMINESGNVGINTATPNLVGYGANAKVLSIVDQGTNGDYGAIEIGGYRTSDGLVGDLNFINTNGSSAVSSRAIVRGIRDGANDALGLAFYTEATGASVSEKVRIDSAGRVGIGTTSAYASSTLTLNGNQSALAISRNTGTDPTWTLSSDATTLYLSDDGNTTYNMAWKNDGSVGIGKHSGMSKTLHVDSNTGNASTPNGIMLHNYIHGSDSQIYMYAENDSGVASSGAIKYDPDLKRMKIIGSGSVGLYIDHTGHTNFESNINLPDDIALSLGSSTDAQIWNDGSHTYFRNNTASQDMIFKVRVSSTDTEALRIDGATGTVSVNSTLYVGSGVRHEGDADNAIIFGTDTQEYITGGTTRLTLNNTNATFSGNILASNGTEAAPAYAFSGQASTGMYKGGTNLLYFSVAGTRKVRVESTQIVLEDDVSVNNTLTVIGNSTFGGNISLNKSSANQYILKNTGGSLRLKHEGTSAGDDIIFELSDGGTQHTFDHNGSIVFGGNILLSKSSDGSDTSFTINNSAGVGSTNETSSLIFQTAGMNAGKIVSARSYNYSSEANRDSHLKFYTAVDNVDTLALEIASNNDAIFSSDVKLSQGKKIIFNGNTYITEEAADKIRFYTDDTLALTLDSSQNTFVNGKLYIGSNNNVNIFTSDAYNRNLEFNMYDSTATAYRTVMFLDGVTTGTGQVGIGTTSPSALLHLYGGTQNATGGIRLTIDDTGVGATDGTALFIEQNSSDFFIRNYEDAGIRMRTHDTDALYIDDDQNVGIGTITPNQQLEVANSAGGASAGAVIRLSNTNTDVTSADVVGKIEAYIKDSSQTNLPGIAGDLYWVTNGNLDGGLNRGTDFAIRVFKTSSLHTALIISSDKTAENFGTVTINTSSDAHLMLKGSSNPYIDFYEGTTRKAWLQWHSNGEFFMRNNETQLQYTQSTVHAFSGGDVTISGGTNYSQLVIKGAGSETGIRFKDSDDNTEGWVYANSYAVGFLDEGAHWTIKAQNNTGIYFSTNQGSQHMQILNSGNVNIGATSDTYKLNVAGTLNCTGNVTFSGTSLSVTNTALIGTCKADLVASGNGTVAAPSISFKNDSDTGFYLTSGDGIAVANAGSNEFLFEADGDFHADGDVIGFSTSVASDKRLKTDVEELEGNLDNIMKLEPVKFDWLVKDKGEDIGFIAQDVQRVVPEVVKEVEAIGHTAEFLDDDTMLTVDYAKLVPVLVGAIQELKQEIEELKHGVSS